MARFKVDFDGVMDRLEELEQENHRLRTALKRRESENAWMRTVVEQVAAPDGYGMYTPYYPPAGRSMQRCNWCKGVGYTIATVSHSPHCLMILAQAFLASQQTESAGRVDSSPNGH